jgi:hypothetical protein
MKRALTHIEKRALAFLATGPKTCNDLGSELWYGVRTHGGGSSNPFSRPAGRLLHRLLRMGLVRKKWNESGRLVWASNGKKA